MSNSGSDLLLKLSIHRQIQVGISSISTCIFVLMFGLISINSFVVINIMYNEIKHEINIKQNSLIQAVVFNLESELKIGGQHRNLAFQNVRNFIETYKTNSDFVDIYENLEVDKSIVNYSDTLLIKSQNCETVKTNCFMFSNLDTLPSAKEKDFNTYKKILKINMQNIKFMIDFITNSGSRVYDNFIILSVKFNSLFVYPYYPKNPVFNLASMRSDIANQLEFLKGRLTGILPYQEVIQNNISTSNSTNSITIHKPMNYTVSNMISLVKVNPFLIVLPQTANIHPLDKVISQLHYYEFSLILDKTKFTGINTISDEKLFIADNVEDVFLGEFYNQDLLGDYLQDYSNKYQGFKMMLVTRETQTNIKQGRCLYFLKLYEIENGYTNYTSQSLESFKETYNNNITSKIYDCFLGEAKNDLEKYFKDTNFTLNRIIDIILYKDLDIEYKIFNKEFPSLSCDVLVKSLYIDSYPTNIMVFYNLNYQRNQTDNVMYHFIAKQFNIMSINLLVWIGFFIIMILLLSRLAANISTPIKKLLNAINSIGRNKQDPKQDVEGGVFDSIDDIGYPHDKDINDMFQICKTIIKGGFSQAQKAENDDHYLDNLNKQISYLSHAYNNVSYIKTNNFIIEEDILEKACSNQSSIFSFNLDEKSQNNDEKKLLELISKNYYISDDIEGKETILETEREDMFDLVEKYNVDYESHPYFDYYNSGDLRILSI